MPTETTLRLWVVFAFLLLGLVSCELERPEGDVSDISPLRSPAARGEGAFIPPLQAGNAVIRFEPSSLQLINGGSAVVQVRVDNVVDLAGVDVEIRFDPNVLQVDDADPNQSGVQIQPGGFLSPDFIAVNSADNITGVIKYIAVQLAPTPPVTGSGAIALINFRAVNTGVSNLTLPVVNLTDIQPQNIPTEDQPGEIIIVQDGVTGTPTVVLPTGTVILPPATATETPTPTPTPTITDTPTPTATFTPTVTPTPSDTPTPISPKPNVKIPYDATFGVCYIVKEHDDIHDIAYKFHVPPKVISVVNDLYPPLHVYTHLPLFIPTKLGHGPNVYVVEAGDTLEWIARSCLLDIEYLAEVNEIDPNANLPIGYKLIIPIPPFPNPQRFRYPLDIVDVPFYVPPKKDCCDDYSSEEDYPEEKENDRPAEK